MELELARMYREKAEVRREQAGARRTRMRQAREGRINGLVDKISAIEGALAQATSKTYAKAKHWKQARVVPWLLCHLGAVLYRVERRPDLVKLSARVCKHVYDAFIEHLNAIFKHLAPTNSNYARARSTRQCRRETAPGAS